MEDEKSYWPIPKDLATLHDVIIGYAVRIHMGETGVQPVSHRLRIERCVTIPTR